MIALKNVFSFHYDDIKKAFSWRYLKRNYYLHFVIHERESVEETEGIFYDYQSMKHYACFMFQNVE